MFLLDALWVNERLKDYAADGHDEHEETYILWFEPMTCPEDSLWLQEMQSTWEYGRLKRALGLPQGTNRRRKCVVLGATSAIGRPLCHALAGQGHQVAAVDAFADRAAFMELEGAGVTCIEHDILEHSLEAIENVDLLPDADLVFLCVWDPHHPLTGDEGVQDPWQVVQGVQRVVMRYAGSADIINGSSGEVYGPREDRPSTESDPIVPKSEYAMAVASQEQMVNTIAAQVGGTRVMHLRFFYGVRMGGGLVQSIARKLLDGMALGDTPQKRLQIVGLADMVRCTLLAPEFASPATAPCVVNICHPTVWTFESLANQVQLEMGPHAKEVRFMRQNVGSKDSIWGDHAKMEELFGLPDESLKQIIKDVSYDVIMESKGL